MPIKPKRTWIVIADGMRARILRQDKRTEPPVPALDRDLYAPDVHGFARDLKSEKPGRAFDTGSGGRHAMQPRNDPHQQQKHAFARHISGLLNDAAKRRQFERLILVAPPKMLGELRAGLDAHATDLVGGELARDLVHLPIADLQEHLETVLPP